VKVVSFNSPEKRHRPPKLEGPPMNILINKSFYLFLLLLLLLLFLLLLLLSFPTIEKNSLPSLRMA
jgi:hypothetical protein